MDADLVDTLIIRIGARAKLTKPVKGRRTGKAPRRGK